MTRVALVAGLNPTSPSLSPITRGSDYAFISRMDVRADVLWRYGIVRSRTRSPSHPLRGEVVTGSIGRLHQIHQNIRRLPTASSLCEDFAVMSRLLLPDRSGRSRFSFTTRADDSHAASVHEPRREGVFQHRSRACQAWVRFFALRRIKPHAPPLVRAPVNSFEFQPCGRTPQAGHLMR